MDKVRPLKLENPSAGGTEFNPVPTEADPLEDYLSAKGFSFEDSADHFIDLDPISKEFRYQDGPGRSPVVLSQVIRDQYFETVTLSAGDISNQYLMLTSAVIGVPFIMIDGIMLRPTLDFAVDSIDKRKVNFAGQFVSGAETAFASGDVLHVWYLRSISN